MLAHPTIIRTRSARRRRSAWAIIKGLLSVLILTAIAVGWFIGLGGFDR